MNVPKLRFPEFNSDWNETTLKNIATINPKNETLPDKFIYIDLESVNKGILSQEKIISKSNAPSRAQRIIKKNDILFQTVRPYQQNNYFVEEIKELPYVASTGYALIRTNEDSYFVYSLLHKKDFLDKVIDRCTGTSFPAISSNDLGEININIPDIQEQTKISNFLSLLDKKIELQTKKIEALKLFKLGLRNELFREPQNIKIKLRNLVKCESSTITLKDIENDFGLYPIYGATGLIKNISKYNFENKYIAIIKDGAGVGRTILCNGKSSILATMNALIPKNEYPINYICEHINRIKFEKYIVGSGIPHIYFKDYGNEELSIHSLEEAYKIDLVFKNLDKKIELLYNKLNKLSELKKGLMQSMFV